MTDFNDAWAYFKQYASYNNPIIQEKVWLKWQILKEFLSVPELERLTTAWTKAMNNDTSAEFQIVCEDVELSWGGDKKN